MFFFDVALLTQGIFLFVVRNSMSSTIISHSLQFALIGRVAIGREFFSFNSGLLSTAHFSSIIVAGRLIHKLTHGIFV